MVPIYDLNIGDRVLAYNEATDKIEFYPITEVHENLDPVTINLTIDTDTTDDKPGLILETTPEHPFYVSGTWTNAEDLMVGTILTSFDGQDGLTLLGIITATERIEQEQTMYNLTVDTAYIFFVGEGEWLVHNTNCLFYLLNNTHKGSLPIPKGLGPNGGKLQSHHGLQQEWAKNNLSAYGYDQGLAPSITLETGVGFPHTTITNLQRARRDARTMAGLGKWSTTIDEELGFIVSDFRTAGFGDDVIKQVLEQQYQMPDELGVTYSRPPGF